MKNPIKYSPIGLNSAPINVAGMAMPWIRKGVDTVVDKVKNTIRRSNEAQKLYQEDRNRGVKFNRYESVSDTLKRHGLK
jgi:hypothetical protein